MATSASAVASKWSGAAPGEVNDFSGETIARITLKPSKRPKGSAPVTIKSASFTRDPAVGSTDTIMLKSGLRDLILEDVAMQADDRSGLKTEGPLGARRVSLIGCRIIGLGNPTDPNWKDDVKWAQHHYFTGGWSEVGTITESIYQEHAWYGHQIQGNHAFSGCKTKWCGRTRIQIVNRAAESGDPMPIGYGDMTFIDDEIEDVCLEGGGGGSAYTFRGGMPDSIVTLTRSKVRLGCNAALAAPFNKNITGALVMDSSPESKKGAGDMAHPGGTEQLILNEPDFEVGTVYPGVGSARRPNVKVGAVGSFTINWGSNGRIVQGPSAFTIALEIQGSCQSFRWAGDPVQFVGQVKYKGTLYPSWAAFATANAALRA